MRITVYLHCELDLYQEARNYITEIFAISLVGLPVINWWRQTPLLKKNQRVWAIWKSGQNCVGGAIAPSLSSWRRLCKAEV